MDDDTVTSAADGQVKQLHADLRKTNPGKWAVFLGAGASYDYGIPTMAESASVLREVLAGQKKTESAFGEQTKKLLNSLIPKQEGASKWDIEQLLTKLYQLLEATSSTDSPFAATSISIDGQRVSDVDIKTASNELLRFHVEMCQLSAKEYCPNRTGSVDYLADFLQLLSGYDNSGLRVFTINIDQCLEAAVTRMAHRPSRHRRPDFTLADGFGASILPVFDLRNFTARTATELGAYPVYLWKLHGSVDWRFSRCSSTGACSQAAGTDAPSTETERIIVRTCAEPLAGQLQSCGALQQKPDSEDIVVFPTPAKYSQTYTFPYMDLFEAFRRTVEDIDLMLVVGTSFPDQHIRSVIKSFAHREGTQLYVIDPAMEQTELERLFDRVGSLQPLISVGLREFVQKLKAVATTDTDRKAT